MGNNTLSIADHPFLFLDRDGVINVHRPNDYVKTIGEFEFLPGVTEALALLSKRFRRIIVVTNQRGVAKGKMSVQNLDKIHNYMMAEIAGKGGRIDAVYYATALSDEDPQRKPNSGMAYRAKNDFPEIDFSRSVMAGDSRSDMAFGKRLKMTTVLIKKECSDIVFSIDFTFPSLLDFALSIENQ
jgi:D-glycero-D-manno-heptose 1,7-bisphosphate phosphatase